MATKSIRIDAGLALQIEREARIQDRSIGKQLEHWTKIGRAISGKLEIADIFAVAQGIKILKVELSPGAMSGVVDSDDVFNDLEENRESLSERVTSARIYYEASVEHPGYLDRVDSATGDRISGLFENGEFTKVL